MEVWGEQVVVSIGLLLVSCNAVVVVRTKIWLLLLLWLNIVCKQLVVANW